MKKLSRSLMLARMTVCLAVCCLFAGCSKQAGTYIGTGVGDVAIELQLKANEELEIQIGDTTKTGTWVVSEEDETIVILTISGANYNATFNEEAGTLKLPIILDGAIIGASLATLVKK